MCCRCRFNSAKSPFTSGPNSVAVLAPPESVWRPVEAFAPGSYGNFLTRLVFGMRSFRGVLATSWYRSPRVNRDVGGHPESQHLLGLAVDLIAEEPQLAVTALTELGLEAFNEATHVHVQYWPAGIAGRLVRHIHPLLLR